MNFHPSIEYKTPEEILTYQEKKLKEMLSYLSLNSPFYKKHLQGIDVNLIRGISDLKSLPVTTKDDLQNFNWDFLCVPRNKVVEYMSTSGTLGKPVTIALTERDLQRLAYNEAVSFACAQGSEKDCYQLMLTLDRQFMAGIAYYQGIRLLGASVVRVGPGVPSMQLDCISRLRPTALVAVPSFLLKLIDYAKDHGVDLNQTSVRKAICIGEPLRAENFDLGVIGKKIRDSWDIELYSTYASTEMQTAFTECIAGHGGHLRPELLVVELLNEKGEPVKSGERGEITITTLGVEGMPLLRYKTGDISTAHSDRCVCGRTTLRIGPIVGRKQHQIKLKGTTIYPAGVYEILNELDFIQDYVVEALTGEVGTDELRLHLVVNGEITDGMVNKLNNVFQSRLRVLPLIDFTSPGQLEKIQLGKGERKARRFIDNRLP